MDTYKMDNDTRGWILTTLSAIACVLGASIIFVDLIIRYIPGKKDFRIQDSNAFLSCSLCLSAGVMLVSALSKMLISSMKSLQESGFNSQQSGLIAYSCLFLGGCGIRLLTGLIHRLMPSKSVDCEHTHEDEPQHEHSHVPDKQHSETTPLLQHSKSNGNGAAGHDSSDEMQERQKQAGARPSLQSRISSTVSMLRKGSKHACDANGPCYGYSDPCGEECFKNINQRGGRGSRLSPWNGIKRPTATLRHSTAGILSASVKPLRSIDEEANIGVPRAKLTGNDSRRKNSDTAVPSATISEQPDLHTADADTPLSQSSTQGSHASHEGNDHEDNETSGQSGAHHHHIPTNKFLSIGLQTSIAIALHKLPEGFITYATNHANPKLGFTVFLAIAIHNVTEGFALALPLYLATNSRIRALLYSIVLGGLSQPLGAGIAALWLHFAEKGRGDQNQTDKQQAVYGVMFALTAGIMTSVAFGLMLEGTQLGHNKTLAVTFIFVGAFILGASSALTG